MTVPNHSRQVAYVEWIDSGILAAGWEARDKVLGEALTDSKDPIRSAGFVLSDNHDGIVLCVSLNETHEDVNLAMFIPRACIRRMDTWTPRRKRG